MSEAEFWLIIESTRPGCSGYGAARAQRLTALLTALNPPEIVSFSPHFEDAMEQAYTAAVYAAANVVYDGATDDSFEDFRGWMISQGKDLYLRALDDPDCVADSLNAGEAMDQIGCGEWLQADADAYEALTGVTSGPLVFHYGSAERFGPPEGEEWTAEELPRRLPKLWAKFGASRALRHGRR